MSSGFTFNISLSVLNHLGRNLYRSFITVLGEAISNSWDADANNVWIYIDRENNTLIVKDDGVGMTSDDFQNKFLKVGYSKRKNGTTTTSKRRPFIGRKGIGKLALLSCAKTISVITKTENSDFVGGTIDNSGLDKAIQDDLSANEYGLDTPDFALFRTLSDGMSHGTIIYFQDINDGIKNKVDYIRKLIALYFRFSILDEEFSIFLNDKEITLDELSDLASDTQLLWLINDTNDRYVTEKLLPNANLQRSKKVKETLLLNGFIASVEKPSQLKIRGSEEKVSVDLYVNGRLREKDLLRHINTTRLVESYLYGQVHFNSLDDETDRFTSSREGIVSDDPKFLELIEAIKRLLNTIILNDWDVWRGELRQSGDPDNKRLTAKERKSKELFDTVVDEFIPPKGSSERSKIEDWINKLQADAEFNFGSYADCFLSENLVREYIIHKKIPLSKEAKSESDKWQKRETDAKGAGNISFDIRRNPTDATYLDMGNLANLADKVDSAKQAGLSRDAKEYKPIRDAVAHTALLTDTAKTRLNLTYENIKGRIKELLKTP
jgi:hypothetical protein